MSAILGCMSAALALLDAMPADERVNALNEIRQALHERSPFASEPVDCVLWVKSSDVHANDYNPNSVAPPEMELLRLSISADGYTQPIVTFPHDGAREVVDGFHRHRVGKECADIQARVQGYLPVVTIKESQHDKANRMAATIRHNRARGKHKVEAMSEIVVELKRRFWSDEKIATELGMEPDEVLRLQQITGLSTLFADRQFSEAWEAESFTGEDEIEEIQEGISPLAEVRGIPQQHVAPSADSGPAELPGQLSLLDD
jgi:ParB-like chromosome segregation protein Spo0J